MQPDVGIEIHVLKLYVDLNIIKIKIENFVRDIFEVLHSIFCKGIIRVIETN